VTGHRGRDWDSDDEIMQRYVPITGRLNIWGAGGRGLVRKGKGVTIKARGSGVKDWERNNTLNICQKGEGLRGFREQSLNASRDQNM